MEIQKHSVEDYLRHIGATVPSVGHGWRKMKCPFHLDTHASAGVNFDENRFKCHGCGVGGDTYDLIMERERMNYHEAVKFAETISPSSNAAVRLSYSSGRTVSTESGIHGRRGKKVPPGRSERRASRS